MMLNGGICFIEIVRDFRRRQNRAREVDVGGVDPRASDTLIGGQETRLMTNMRCAMREVNDIVAIRMFEHSNTAHPCEDKR
jgi:hypothetical protein